MLPAKNRRTKQPLYVHYTLALWYMSFVIIKKKAKIKNQYNQVPHLIRDTIWESDKNTQESITHKKAKRSALSQQVIPRLQGIEKTV